jgi:RimJ/RimL family protein N-acetyltransferase
VEGGGDAGKEPPGPSHDRVVIGGVTLRPVTTNPGGVRFDIIVGRECAGWLELAGTREVMRLSGEVSERFRGRGVATAAVAAACRIAYSTMETSVLEAVVPNGLGAAHRVLEANGFSVADLRDEPLRFELNRTTWSRCAGR